MKTISKSKRQLAQLLIEAGVTKFPEGANWAAQDKCHGRFSRNCGFYRARPVKPSAGCNSWSTAKGDYKGIVGVWIETDTLIPNWHQVVLSRDEFDQIVAETVVQGEPDSDGWIEFDGTERPSGYFNKMIDVKLHDGRVMTDSSGRFEWDTSGPSRIVAYRPHKPEQVEPRYCESVTRSIPEPATAPTLDQLLHDWRNADDCAQRKQTEADEAAAMRDERWRAVQDRAGEIGVTIGGCKAVVADPDLVITDWRDLRVGDVVEIIWSTNGAWEVFEGKELVVAETGDYEDDLLLMSDSGGEWYASSNTQWRFIRRP